MLLQYSIVLKTSLTFEKNVCVIDFVLHINIIVAQVKTNNNSRTEKQKFVKARQTRNFNYRL